jgi:F0F1-type ATP synthase delta subunit
VLKGEKMKLDFNKEAVAEIIDNIEAKNDKVVAVAVSLDKITEDELAMVVSHLKNKLKDRQVYYTINIDKLNPEVNSYVVISKKK